MDRNEAIEEIEAADDPQAYEKAITYALHALREDVPREEMKKIYAEIERRCDRINSLSSTLRYPAHREIQELLCEILELIKADKGQKKHD